MQPDRAALSTGTVPSHKERTRGDVLRRNDVRKLFGGAFDKHDGDQEARAAPRGFEIYGRQRLSPCRPMFGCLNRLVWTFRAGTAATVM